MNLFGHSWHFFVALSFALLLAGDVSNLPGQPPDPPALPTCNHQTLLRHDCISEYYTCEEMYFDDIECGPALNEDGFPLKDHNGNEIYPTALYSYKSAYCKEDELTRGAVHCVVAMDRFQDCYHV